VDPWLIPDRWDDQPWPAVYLGRLWELQSAQAVLQRGIVPGLKPVRQEQTQSNRFGLGPDPGEGISRRVAVIAAADGCGELRIAQQPIGADKGQRGGRIATRQASQLLRQFGAGLRAIACAYGSLGDDHPLVSRIVFEHHRVSLEATGGSWLVS